MENKTKRVAIMVTDIVGYSLLMSEDPRKAVMVLDKNRMIHRTAIKQFNGTFIKEIGDGILSIYENSIDAVRCALEIRKNCCREAMLQLRIGIHVGNVIIRYSDLLGDGVNIASHIEASGAPGGIYLSERVVKEIKDKIEIPIEFYEEKILKNIPYPIRIFNIPPEKAILEALARNTPPKIEA